MSVLARRSSVRLLAILLTAFAVFVGSACSSDDGNNDAGDGDTTTDAAVEDSGDADDQDDSEDATDEDSDIPEADHAAYGYRISGEPGTSITIKGELDLGLGEQQKQPLEQTWVLQDQAIGLLFNTMAIGGELSFDVSEDGLATVEIIHGPMIEFGADVSQLDDHEVIAFANDVTNGTVDLTFP